MIFFRYGFWSRLHKNTARIERGWLVRVISDAAGTPEMYFSSGPRENVLLIEPGQVGAVWDVITTYRHP
mgnify:FL=1